MKSWDTKDDNHIWDVRQTAGMVFQNPDNQLVSSIVEDDVAFGPENLGIEPQEIRKRVDQALESVNMGKYKKKAPHLLSCLLYTSLTAFLYKGENRPTQLIAQGFSQGDILITCDDTDSAADWFSLQNGTLSYEVGESASIWKIGNLTNTITATAGEHGAISPSGTCTVNQGEDAEFKICLLYTSKASQNER